MTRVMLSSSINAPPYSKTNVSLSLSRSVSLYSSTVDISDDGQVEMLVSLVCQSTYKMVVYEQTEG